MEHEKPEQELPRGVEQLIEDGGNVRWEDLPAPASPSPFLSPMGEGHLPGADPAPASSDGQAATAESGSDMSRPPEPLPTWGEPRCADGINPRCRRHENCSRQDGHQGDPSPWPPPSSTPQGTS